MYPEQPQQQPQLSSEPIPANYLDQISAPAGKSGPSNKLFFGVIIGGAILVIIAVLLLMSSGGGGKQISVERLSLRLQNLQSISKDSHKNIKSTQLRALNSRLTTQLTDINREIAAPLASAGITAKTIDKKTSSQEAKLKTDIMAALDDSRLNATFDRDYSREMSFQMENTAILMDSIFKSTKSKSLKDFLSKSYPDFSALQKEFASYSSASR